MSKYTASEQEPHYKSLSDAISKIEKSDVIFKCRDGEVGALSFILEARSEVFRALFSGKFEGERVIDAADCSAKVVKDFKDYIYTADISTLTDDYSINEIYELYTLADKYMFDDLKSEVRYYLEVAADYETFEFIDFALKNMAGTELGDWIIDVALDNARRILSGQACSNLGDVGDIPDQVKIKVFNHMLEKAIKNKGKL